MTGVLVVSVVLLAVAVVVLGVAVRHAVPYWIDSFRDWRAGFR